MRPGDQVKCSRCGTTATAYTTDVGRWRDGDALILSWRGHRHQVARTAPEVCLFCHYGDAPPPRPPGRRTAICDDLAVHGCQAHGFEWNTDQAVEDAYQRWVAAGRPLCAIVPVNGEVSVDELEDPPPAPPAKKAGQLSLFG